MSNFIPPPTVQLVCWTGESTTLACRLGIPHDALLTRLRRNARHGDRNTLTVEVSPANSEPLFNALRRKLLNETNAPEY